MSRQDVFEMPFEKVYQCLVQKAERKVSIPGSDVESAI